MFPPRQVPPPQIRGDVEMRSVIPSLLTSDGHTRESIAVSRTTRTAGALACAAMGWSLTVAVRTMAMLPAAVTVCAQRHEDKRFPEAGTELPQLTCDMVGCLPFRHRALRKLCHRSAAGWHDPDRYNEEA